MQHRRGYPAPSTLLTSLSPVPRRLPALALVCAVTLGALSACAAKEGDDIGSPIFNGTTPDGQTVDPPRTTLPIPTIDAIRVPLDSFSIQGAVDIAEPGDLILIDPGLYTEEVIVRTNDIVIRGRDRNTVFIDGVHSLNDGVTVLADGVALENLTVRNYLNDGVSVGTGDDVVPVNRFRAFHVTTSNTGANGIALRNVTNAEIRQGWLSGHAGSGVLVTDCTQCNTLITTTLAQYSARGFSVVGASEGVAIFSSTSQNNRVGIMVEDSPRQPTTGALIAANLVLNNGFTSTPSADPSDDRSFGVGIHVGGTLSTEVTANRIRANTRTGILLSTNNAGTSGDPIAPVVQRNVVEAHPEADIVLAFGDRIVDPSTCVLDNGTAVIGPPGAAEAAACSDTNVAPPEFVWEGEPRSTIPYANGPVPPTIDGLVEPDSILPQPAGPVMLPNPATAAVPEG